MPAPSAQPSRPLTPKQAAFVREYLVDKNATQAAIRAGYSPRRAAEIGSENHRKPQIAAAIAVALGEQAKRTQVNADWVVRRLKRNDRLAIKAGNLAASNTALTKIGDHLGMFADRAMSPDEVNAMLARIGEIVRREVRDASVLERIEQAWRTERVS